MVEDNIDSKKKEDNFDTPKKPDDYKVPTNEPESKEVSPDKNTKSSSKIIIVAIIAVIVLVGAGVAFSINQNIPIVPEVTQNKDTEPSASSELTSPTPEASSPPTTVAAQLSADKREFIPEEPIIQYLKDAQPEELESREKALQEILGENYLTPYDRFIAPLIAPMYLEVAANPTGKAAIIDMLWDKLPNRDFIQRSNDMLAKAGYEVDIYLTNEATIDLYKKLPSMDYDYIVWRTHGLAQGAIEKSSTIYSGEKWVSGKYYNEQLAGQIKFGVPYTPAEVEEIGWQKLGPETYYTVGSTFVNEVMQGEFDDTVIILGGCDALSGNILANSFIDKGASLVIGWTHTIGDNENDEGILLMLEDMLINKNVPEYAAKTAMDKLKISQYYKDSRLTFVSSKI